MIEDVNVGDLVSQAMHDQRARDELRILEWLGSNRRRLYGPYLDRLHWGGWMDGRDFPHAS